jgi:hypothetical protein
MKDLSLAIHLRNAVLKTGSSPTSLKEFLPKTFKTQWQPHAYRVNMFVEWSGRRASGRWRLQCTLRFHFGLLAVPGNFVLPSRSWSLEWASCIWPLATSVYTSVSFWTTCRSGQFRAALSILVT